jgi:hypothetical protein
MVGRHPIRDRTAFVLDDDAMNVSNSAVNLDRSVALRELRSGEDQTGRDVAAIGSNASRVDSLERAHRG